LKTTAVHNIDYISYWRRLLYITLIISAIEDDCT